MGRQITLAQALAQGDDVLMFWCAGWPHQCLHDALHPVEDAITRFGPHVRMDDVPRRCTRCGRAGGEVRAFGAKKPFTGPEGPRDHARRALLAKREN